MMSSNLPLVHQSRRVLPFLLCIIKFSMYGQGGHKLEINIPPQQIFANSKGGGGGGGGLIYQRGCNFE